MANQITDNRTLIDSADSVGSYVGSTSPVLDTDVKIQGTGSIAEQITNSRRWVMFNVGSTQNWSNNVLYIWINSGIVGLLETRANGGMAIRVAGSNTSDFKEWYVGGSDSWPNAVSGGWVQFVVDLEATADAAGGAWTTTQANTAIQHVGYSSVTSGTMTKVADNTWMDASYRLADGTPGIIVEGRNGGTTPWTFADILTQIGTGSGAFRAGPGGSWVLNTSLQIGINDTTTHEFSDTNQIVLLDDQIYIPVDNYKISALGNAGGTTNITLGIKSGTGDSATGSQGCTIAAKSSGVRWDMDFNDPNLNSVGLYGCSFIHGGRFDLDSAAVEVISSLYIDDTVVYAANSLQLRNSIIDADSTTGLPFMRTDQLDDIRYCTFQFSSGSAVLLTTPLSATQASVGNIFNGFSGTPGSNLTPSSGSVDSAIYNNTNGAVTINVTNGGSTPSIRNGPSATTTVVAGSVTVTIKAITATGTPIQNARVLLETSDGSGPFPYQDTVTIVNSGTTATVTHTAHGMATGDKTEIRGASHAANNGIKTITVTDADTYTYTMGSSPGSNPTGTITSTFILIDGLTDVNGEISMTKVFSSNQNVKGTSRKSTSSPYYQASPITGTVNSATGMSQNVVMISDE